jgi:surface protein
MIKELNEQIQRLRDVLVTCYNAIKRKGGTIPEEGERNMTNLPAAVLSIPQVHGELTELKVTANGEYLPEEGVDGFSKVTAKFDTSSLGKVKVTSFNVTKDCINEEGRWEGDQLIDVSLCTAFDSKFKDFNNLRTFNGSGWDTSNIQSFFTMFRYCTSLEYANIDGWVFNNSPQWMFNGCSALAEISAKNVVCKNMNTLFNSTPKITFLDLSTWNVEECVTTQGAFSACSIIELNAKGWNLSKVKSCIEMFSWCSNLEIIKGTEDWNLHDVTNIKGMFYQCNKLKSLDTTNWDFSNVVACDFTFLRGCTSLETLIGNHTLAEAENNTIKCFNGMSINLDLSNLNKLERASLRAVINGLADVTDQPAESRPTLSLGTTLMAQLTEEDITIATDEKGWNLA